MLSGEKRNRCTFKITKPNKQHTKKQLQPSGKWDIILSVFSVVNLSVAVAPATVERAISQSFPSGRCEARRRTGASFDPASSRSPRKSKETK